MSRTKSIGHASITPEGAACGWSVTRTWNGWQWSAYGPGGMDVGWALTRASAEEKAQKREQYLRLPVFNLAGRAIER